MERLNSLKRVNTQPEETLDEAALGTSGGYASQTPEKDADHEEGGGGRSAPFMGMKVRRRASIYRECTDGDYIGVQSDPYLMKLLSKQGDTTVLFADTVLKFTGSGKMKRRILLITDFAIYLVDPEADALKRRIALAAVDKLCTSELSDNFIAIIIPTEYDCLFASTRKKEIVKVLVEVASSDYELEVVYSNSFEYNASANTVKEVQFAEVDGGIKTRISKKEAQANDA